MTTADGANRTNVVEARPSTLVWIDAAEAIVVRRQDDRARIERVASDVPAHHRATGHVRHDPAIRHGGGGSPQAAGEPHRLEHLKRFVVDIANRLPEGDDLLIIGPGTVHERLARLLSESDRHHGRHRDVTREVSPPLTDRQLMARLRRFAGGEPRRRTVGAYRWSQPSAHGPSDRPLLLPRRIVNKPPRERGHDAPGE
jgi:hypothetical protein